MDRSFFFLHQDRDFTLNSNTTTTLHTQKTPTKHCLDPVTRSKVIVSTDGTHPPQIDGHFFVLVLSFKTHKTYIYQMERLYFHPCNYNIFCFTYSVCDEKVKRNSGICNRDIFATVLFFFRSVTPFPRKMSQIVLSLSL